MVEINDVVLNAIACLENADILKEISKGYVLKIKKLENYNCYLECSEFKNKKVTKENFKGCLSFLIKQLNDERFRVYTQRNKICLVAFYKKEESSQNILTRQTNGSKNTLASLSSIIVKHYIEEETLYICVNPVKTFRDRIISNQDSIIKHFNANGKKVSEIQVKFIHDDKILDDLSETFLDLGYTIK